MSATTQPSADVTPSAFPGRQAIYVFTIRALEPDSLNLTPFAAELVAERVLGSLADLGPRALISGLFLITAFAAQIMPTAAVAVLMAPIAIETAAAVGVSTESLLMVLAVGSSCAFMSPAGHAVNLLVMGFGGYRFTDFFRAGLPLQLLLWLVLSFTIPWLYLPTS